MARAKDRKESVTIAVPAANDEPVLEALYTAKLEGIADAILIGDEDEIELALKNCDIPQHAFPIFKTSTSLSEQCDAAVAMVLEGEAKCIMKGLVQTSVLLKAILKHKSALLRGNSMNHLAAFEIEGYHKLLFMSDSAMIIAPNLEQKYQMIKNALPVLKAFEITCPKIATLCAKEERDSKMQATLDAQALLEMNQSGQLDNCLLSGPMAMDAAVSKAAADHKGISSKVSGDVDIVIMPSIESGNIFYKTLVQLSEADSAGIVVGASVPIVLTSRSDSAKTKLNAIAMAVIAASAE
nr:phosphate acyltransferase [Fusibacter paucivorans]